MFTEYEEKLFCFKIRLALQSRGLSKVGWYHSHPTCQAYPTLRDIDCQTEYQMKLGTNNPVLALICGKWTLSIIFFRKNSICKAIL